MTWPSGDQYVGDWVNNQRLKNDVEVEHHHPNKTRSGHGLYLYSSGNRYKGQYLAGKKVNSMVVCHLFKAAIIIKNDVILTSDLLGGFWSVLVDDWSPCRRKVCRTVCCWKEVIVIIIIIIIVIITIIMITFALQREGQGSYYFRNGDVFTGT